MKIWYVYIIRFKDGSYYYGYRGSKNPEKDFLIKYYSSSKVVKEKIKNLEDYSGEILGRFIRQKDALEYEQYLIFKHFEDLNILNRVCRFGVKGFHILTASAKKRIGDKSRLRWEDPKFRKQVVKSHKKRWLENPELKKQQSKEKLGKKRPEHSKAMLGKTKCPVNIYTKDGILLAEKVCCSSWAKSNGYDNSCLLRTAKADRSKPNNSKSNKHYYKEMYAKYV